MTMFPWRNYFLKPTSSTPSGRIPGHINFSKALISPAVKERRVALLKGPPRLPTHAASEPPKSLGSAHDGRWAVEG